MRKLFHRIYLALLVVAFLGIAFTALLTHDLLKPRVLQPLADRLEAEAALIDARLPPSGSDAAMMSAVLRDAAATLGLEVALLDHRRRLMASTPGDFTVFHALPTDRNWVDTRSGLARIVALRDGRFLMLRPRNGRAEDLSFEVFSLVLIAFFAVGCYPVARGLTRRLETLETGVRELGAGRFETRVQVDGRDEVARLAASFNWTAERLQRLIESQRRVLASASHELRSPLARLRMALELIAENADRRTQARTSDAIRDVGELDDLVEDLLTASRLEIPDHRSPIESVDLAALLTRESERSGATTAVQPATIDGDARLLRRLVRNLLENARRYGNGTIETGVEPLPGESGARLWVADRGHGVPDNERDRIFEPFYRASSHREDEGGVGLGLFLVRQIAHHHRGEAQCRAREGGGTLFEVVLRGAVSPAASDETAVTTAPRGA